jgi:hypothetical protein
MGKRGQRLVQRAAQDVRIRGAGGAMGEMKGDDVRAHVFAIGRA